MGCNWNFNWKVRSCKIWTIYVKANSAFSVHVSASSLWSLTGRRTCSQFFKPCRRSQLSERDKQLSVGQITQIIAYVSTQKRNIRSSPAKPKLLVPSRAGKGDSRMAGELQLLLLKGTGRAPALLCFVQTQRAGSCQEDSPPCLWCSVGSWNVLSASREELTRDFLKLNNRCLEKSCQSTVVLRPRSWHALHALRAHNTELLADNVSGLHLNTTGARGLLPWHLQNTREDWRALH